MTGSLTIWKFPLTTADTQTISLPYGHRVLTVQTQNKQPCLWVVVNPDNECVPCTFHKYGTGHPITLPGDRLAYVGTYHLREGRLVFHVFEEKS